MLFLAQHVPEPVEGVPPNGSGAHAAATLAGLRRHFDVTPVFAPPAHAVGDARRARVAKHVPPLLRGLRQDLRAIAGDRRFAARATAIGRSVEADVVYARSEYFSVAGLRVASALGAPVVLEVNGLLANDVATLYRSPLAPVGAAVERWKHRRSDAIVTVSPGLARLLVPLGADPAKTTVVPNSVPPERVRVREAREGGDVVVGWVGHLMQWHAVAIERLIDLAPRIAGARFLVVGGGPGLDELRRQADAGGVGDRFRFTGPVPYESLAHVVDEIDVGVIPAVFDYAFPVKLVEFGAAGIPVVAPRSASLDEQLRPGVEYEPFAAGDDAALVDTISGLIEDPDRRRQLGRALQAAVQERFTWDATGDMLREVVERALSFRR